VNGGTFLASLSSGLGALLGLAILVGAGLYFLPTVVGAIRRVVNIGSVFAINLLLGWSLIGWAIALAMALRTNPPYAYREYWQGPAAGQSAQPIDSLERLTALRDRGVISAEEFSVLKSRAIGTETEQRRIRHAWLLWAVPAAFVLVVAIAVPAVLVTPSETSRSGSANGFPNVPATGTPTTANLGSPSTTAPGSVLAAVPLVDCPTAFGVTPSSSPSLPTSMNVSVPPTLANQLAVYSDALGSVEVLAPIGWQCSAEIGADGSTRVVAFPPGAPVPANEQFTAQQGDAVVASETSACVGCAEFQACPLFASAAADLMRDEGLPCRETRPAQEAVYQLSSTIVAFEDPPEVAGDGDPSGGSDPANGVMTYIPTSDNGSWLETCTLPESEHATCTAALNTFVSWYGKQ
jgi:hypothetical protein